DSEDRAIRGVGALPDGDRLMALGVERLAGCPNPSHSLAGEDAVHLFEHSTQAFVAGILGSHPESPFHAVDGLQPVAHYSPRCLGNATLDLTLGSLAVVVEVGDRALVAVLDPGELLGQLIDVGGGDLRSAVRPRR